MTILQYYTYPCIDTRVVAFTRADHLAACRLAAKAKGLASARNSPLVFGRCPYHFAEAP